MIEKLVSWFLKSYEDSPREIQNKAKILLLTAITLLFAGSMIIPLQFIENPNIVSTSSVIVTILICIIALVLIKLTHYHIVCFLVSVSSLVFVTILQFTISKTNTIYEMIQLLGLLIASVGLITLININRKLHVLYSFLSFGCLLSYFFIIAGSGKWEINWDSIRLLIESSMVMGMIIVLSFVNLQLLLRQVKLFKTESEKNEDRYSKIKKVRELL